MTFILSAKDDNIMPNITQVVFKGFSLTSIFNFNSIVGFLIFLAGGGCITGGVFAVIWLNNLRQALAQNSYTQFSHGQVAGYFIAANISFLFGLRFVVWGAEIMLFGDFYGILTIPTIYFSSAMLLISTIFCAIYGSLTFKLKDPTAMDSTIATWIQTKPSMTNTNVNTNTGATTNTGAATPTPTTPTTGTTNTPKNDTNTEALDLSTVISNDRNWYKIYYIGQYYLGGKGLYDFSLLDANNLITALSKVTTISGQVLIYALAYSEVDNPGTGSSMAPWLQLLSKQSHTDADIQQLKLCYVKRLSSYISGNLSQVPDNLQTRLWPAGTYSVDYGTRLAYYTDGQGFFSDQSWQDYQNYSKYAINLVSFYGSSAKPPAILSQTDIWNNSPPNCTWELVSNSVQQFIDYLNNNIPL